MDTPPEYIDEIEQELHRRGQELQEEGKIGWNVEKDYMFRLNDRQADARGARTGEIYRTTDPDLSLDYIGASFYLDLEGEPLDIVDHDYGLWFEIVNGMPRVEVQTDLELWDPDPIYSEVEQILDDHDLPLVHPEEAEEATY